MVTTELLSSLPPELYDLSMVSLKLVQSNFILIYLVRIERLILCPMPVQPFIILLEFTSASSDVFSCSALEPEIVFSYDVTEPEVGHLGRHYHNCFYNLN